MKIRIANLVVAALQKPATPKKPKMAANAAGLAARNVQQRAVAAVPVAGLAARSVQQRAVAAVPAVVPAAAKVASAPRFRFNPE